MKSDNTLDVLYRSIWGGDSTIMPIAGIWLDKPLMTADKLTKRITEGDRVLIEDGELKDCLFEPTHVITSCHGKVSSDFSIHVMDIKTNQLSIIKI